MFDQLRVPESMAALPGRVVANCWDDEPVKRVTLPPPRLAIDVLEARRARERAYYWANRERILAKQRAAYVRKRNPKPTREERLAQMAAYWAANRDRIKARRKALKEAAKAGK